MNGSKYYIFETRSGNYHSDKFVNPAECKCAAFEVSKINKEDVMLIGSDGVLGHVYAKWLYNNGEPKYIRTRG